MGLNRSDAVRSTTTGESAAPGHWAELERQLTQFLRATPLGVLVTDHRGIITAANDGALSLFGYAEAELIGQSVDLLVPASVLPKHERLRIEYMKDPQERLMASRELRGRHKSGAEIPIALGLNPVRFDGALKIVCTVLDLSERVEMERRLQAQTDRERAILDNTHAIIYIKDVNNRYLFVNRRFTDLFSVPNHEIIGKTDFDIFPEAMARAFQKNDNAVVHSGQRMEVEELAPHADGPHTYVSLKFPLRDSQGQIIAVAGISTDQTDRLRAREVDHELRLARIVQQRLYPAAALRVAGFDLAGSTFPMSQMCGDYFDFITREPNRLVMVVGDVAGHGLGPAMQMVELRALLRLLLQDHGALPAILERLNRQIYPDIAESSFISLFVAELDLETNKITYAGAGHEALILKADGRAVRLASTGMVLGISETAVYDPVEPIVLESRDVMVLFTDGAIEAMAPDGQVFGMKQLIAAIHESRDAPARPMLDHVFERITSFAGAGNLRDDVTIIIAKPT